VVGAGVAQQRALHVATVFINACKQINGFIC
jgi:hypothetical protein